MNPVPLGRTGLTVSPVCFGGNVFGWTLDRQASFDMLDRCLDAGLNFVDTADVYSAWVPGHRGGESEALIGDWLAARGPAVRAKMVIATKVGMDMTTHRPNLKPGHIAKSVDASLQRLRTDHIDLYYAHRDDQTLPMADVLGAFGDLVQAGKVRALGASNFTAARLDEAFAVRAQSGGARYDVLQNEYNLHDRSVETNGVAEACARHGVAMAPFYTLASGFLTGKYRTTDDAEKSPRGAAAVKKYLDARGLRILSAMDAVAAPIASATSVAQTEELLGAMRLTLTSEQLSILAAASQKSPPGEA